MQKYWMRDLKALAPFCIVPPRPAGYLETYSLYMARFQKRDELIQYLRTRN